MGPGDIYRDAWVNSPLFPGSLRGGVTIDVKLSNEFMENRVHFGVMERQVTNSKSCLGNLWSNFRFKLSPGYNLLTITYFHEISNDFRQMKCIV